MGEEDRKEEDGAKDRRAQDRAQEDREEGQGTREEAGRGAQGTQEERPPQEVTETAASIEGRTCDVRPSSF